MEGLVKRVCQQGKFGIVFWEEPIEEDVRFYCGLLNHALYNENPQQALENMSYIVSDSFENAIKELVL